MEGFPILQLILCHFHSRVFKWSRESSTGVAFPSRFDVPLCAAAELPKHAIRRSSVSPSVRVRRFVSFHFFLWNLSTFPPHNSRFRPRKEGRKEENRARVRGRDRIPNFPNFTVSWRWRRTPMVEEKETLIWVFSQEI